MRCISCESNINPQWQYAIAQNVCPMCGKHIMEEHLKNLLASLRETMEKLQDYPDQVNDWMLSNFNFIKTDSPKLIEYLPEEIMKEHYKDLKKSEDEMKFQEKKKHTVKVKTETGEEEVQVEKIQSDEKTNDFFKRAEVKLTVNKGDPQSGTTKSNFNSISEKTEYLKNLKGQIEKYGSASITDESGLASMISPEMMENANSEEVADYQSLISSGEFSSAIPDISDDDDDHIPSVVLNMAKRGGNKSNQNADLEKLQNMRAKVSESRKNFLTGAKGSFSR